MAKPSRTAPKAGYSTQAKADYRVAVWREFSKVAPLDEGHSLILPSTEGLEIKSALSAGVEECALIGVDMNPAIIAAAKWRKSHPNIKVIGARVGDTPNRLHRMGATIRIANLDLCSTVNLDIIGQLKDFVNLVPTNGTLTVAVTIAKGREDSLVSALLNYNKCDSVCADPRLNALLHLAGLVGSDQWKIKIHKEASYVSGHHPMAWCVFTVELWDKWFKRDVYPMGEIFNRLRYSSIHGPRSNIPVLAADLARQAQTAGLPSVWSAWNERFMPERIWYRYASLVPDRQSGVVYEAVNEAMHVTREQAAA